MFAVKEERQDSEEIQALKAAYQSNAVEAPLVRSSGGKQVLGPA